MESTEKQTSLLHVIAHATHCSGQDITYHKKTSSLVYLYERALKDLKGQDVPYAICKETLAAKEQRRDPRLKQKTDLTMETGTVVLKYM